MLETNQEGKTMEKNPKKMEFVKARGFVNYKRLYMMCKFFGIKIDDMLEKSIEELDILLRKSK